MRSSDAVQAVIILACGVVSAAAGGVLSRSGQAPGQGLEDVLGVCLSLLGVVIVGWWVLTLAVAVIAEILERQGLVAAGAFAGRCAPAFMRRLAAALLGVQLLAMPAVAQAAPGGPDAGPGSAVTGCSILPARSTADAGTGADPSGSAGSPYWSPSAAYTLADGLDAEQRPPAPPIPAASSAPAPEPAPVSPAPEPAPAAPAPEPAPVSPAPEPAPTAEPAPVSPAPEPAPAAPAPKPAPVSPVSPVSPAWEPAPMPLEGGLLVRPDTRRTATAEVVVVPGDSLWSIAARRLGPLATAADIAETWPAWFDANRSVIGDDPSLLLPGQVLQAPSP
ncbi:LysM peptidoglycan-binding domain-containing protein [Arthrobacter sp. MDT3-44]